MQQPVNTTYVVTPESFAGYCLLFGVLIVGALYLAGRFGAWSKLSKNYSTEEIPVGTRYESVNIFMNVENGGSEHSKGMIDIIFDEKGMCLVSKKPFRYAFPLVYVPLKDISKSKGSFRRTRLRFKKIPSLIVELDSKSIAEIEAIKADQAF